MMRTPHRFALAFASLSIGAIAFAGPAAAHTEAEATAAPDGRTALAFTFEHGCGTEPTTTFRVQLPRGASGVQPDEKAGWTSTVDAEQVSWTGGSIAGEGSFAMELVLPQPAGTTVFMPAIQECPGGGEEAWIQLPDASGVEPESPSPEFVVPANATTPTTPAPPATTTTEAVSPPSDAQMALEQSPITQQGSEQNNAGLVVGGIAIGAIAIGALVLYLRNRRPAGR